MKIGKLLIGIILLLIGIYLATQAGRDLAGGNRGKGSGSIPLGSVQINYEIKGK